MAELPIYSKGKGEEAKIRKVNHAEMQQATSSVDNRYLRLAGDLQEIFKNKTFISHGILTAFNPHLFQTLLLSSHPAKGRDVPLCLSYLLYVISLAI